MLVIERKGSRIIARTLAGTVEWDSQAGGQITGLSIANELDERTLLRPGCILGDLHFLLDGKPCRLASSSAEVETAAVGSDMYKITARNMLLDGALEVRLEYEIHEEGAMFCNLVVQVADGKRLELGGCGIDIELDVSQASTAMWGYFSREMKYKRDYATVHPYLSASVRRTLDQSAEGRELFPHVSLDLGWGTTRFFANHVEFLMEEWTALDDGPWTNTSSRAGGEGGSWRLAWKLYDGPTTTLVGPRRYRNRWGMLLGRARNRSGPQADPAVRNNALGGRVCHCKYPYARAGDRWPWVSMPIKQVDAQPPQLFEGLPEIARADEAADAGADLMILHQFWMTNPGTNNEPPSDYRAVDDKWLRAFVDRCHHRGIRVLLYVRGTEQWLQYSPFFEEFCQRDFDGMYADWNTVFFMGYGKSSPLHLSMHNYFHFIKSMRQRVGPGGLMIGHTSNTNLITLACYDAALNGETSVRHDELLVNPEMTSYFACLHAVGGHLIAGNLPDRRAFSSPKATALCAALGMTSHAAMEPGLDFHKVSAYMRPLWSAMRALPGRIAQMTNPAYVPTRAITSQHQYLYPCLWQDDSGNGLLLVTNMAGEAQSGAVELDLGEIEVAAGARLRPLEIEGTFTGIAAGANVARLDGIPPERFAAYLLTADNG